MKPKRLLIWTALAYALGIAAMAVSPILVVIVAAFCVTSFVLNRITKREQWGWIALFCLIGIFGGLVFHSRSQVPKNDVSHLAPQLVTIYGTVASDVEGLENPQDKSIPKLKLILNAETVETEPGRTASVTGKIALRLSLSQLHEPVPSYGDRVKIRGRLELPDPPRNPGGMDYRAYLAQRGFHSLMSVRRENWQLIESYNLSNPITRFAYALRDYIQSTPYNYLTPERAATLNGILIGTRNDLPGRLRDDFQRTGTAHIRAASGMNVVLVGIFSLWFFRLFRLTFRYAPHLTLGTILLYTLMANAQPSIVRAAIMGSVLLIGMIIEREPDYPIAIALGALSLLLYDPRNLFDIGFQLSFAAVIVLVLFAPCIQSVTLQIRQRFKGKSFGTRVQRGITEVVTVTLVVTFFAQLGTAPLIACYFSTFSLVGLFANGIVVPMVGFLMATGFIAVALAAIRPFLAVPIYLVIGIILSFLLAVIEFASDLPYSSLNFPLSLFGVCAWYAIVLLTAFRWRRRTQSPSHFEDVQIW